MRRALTVAIVLGALAATPAARAADRFEGGSAFASDDNSDTNNTLSHGTRQDHDLDQEGTGTNDQDWFIVPTQNRHSYEARLYGANQAFSWGACSSCPQFERVNFAGTILTDDAGFAGQGNYFRTVRWTATTTSAETDFIRVTGGTAETETASFTYTIQLWDTTYSIPRWNNAGGQVTVFLIQNVGPIGVAGNVDFYNAAGTLLATQPFTIAVNGSFSLNTSAVGALAGQAGHAFVSHNAGYGGLAGKAVALEPATGFSFDTPMVPIPN